MKNKVAKIVIAMTMMVIIILIIFKLFAKKDYKIIESGNNKSIQEIEKCILNINSYKAKIEVLIKSNKNENKYVLEQIVKNSEYCKQTTLEPKELENMEISYENGMLIVKNNNLELSKIYRDYPYITENQLFLTDFLEEYKTTQNKKIYEKENKIILEINEKDNKYVGSKKMYIKKENLKPEKEEIMDINQKSKVYILYDEIELNI